MHTPCVIHGVNLGMADIVSQFLDHFFDILSAEIFPIFPFLPKCRTQAHPTDSSLLRFNKVDAGTVDTVE